MNFAFSTNAFRRQNLSEAVAAIAQAGYAGVEIMCDRPHAYPPDLDPKQIETIRASISRAGLTISNLNGFMLCAIEDFHHPSWIEPDPDYRTLRVQHTLDCIDLAARLGAGTVSTEPGGPLGGMPRKTALEIFAQGLARAAAHAVRRGVRLLIEPEPGLLIETADEFLSFMDSFQRDHGTEGIGLNFDVGHFFCVGEDPVEKIFSLKDYICHFHLEDIPADRTHQHIQLGGGAVDIPAVLDAVDRIGYKGFVTVELYPYQDSAAKTARQAHDYLKKICGF